MKFYIILDLNAIIDEGFDHIPENWLKDNVYMGKELAEDEMLRLQQIRGYKSKLFLFESIARTLPTRLKNIFRIDSV